jgi:hypothetical protein
MVGAGECDERELSSQRFELLEGSIMMASVFKTRRKSKVMLKRESKNGIRRPMVVGGFATVFDGEASTELLCE